MRVPAAIALTLLLALLAAGCGAGRGKPYTAAGTQTCLRDKGFTHVTANPGKLGLIAGVAANGGLQATTKDGNVLTIAFTAGSADVPDTERAFRLAAPPQYKGRMSDVMSSVGNAVLVWTVTPQQQQLDAAKSCLHP